MNPQELYEKAKQAGIEAGNAAACTPMRVFNHANPQQFWEIEDGVCGFASVIIKPARGTFVKWLKDNKIGYKSYYGGYEFSIHEHNQSMQRKEAHARAMVAVLKEAGLNCYSSSRMD